MKYGSVCSGIEAATAAWHPLGWTPAFFSEIEAAPRAILTHHYPEVPLHGDFTTIGADDYGAIDLLVGGTPCQSFSIAGLRGGLDDDRGNLALEFLRLADRKRPRWLVWENVPGVLSSNGGRDFGSILGGLVELGYGFAYRVLDAQFFGVPQRRRRVFVIGYLGDARRAAAVLFERHSLSGDTPPRREKGQSIAGTFKACAGSGGWSNSADHAAAGYMIPSTGNTAHCLNAGGMGRQDYETETLISHIPETARALTARHDSSYCEDRGMDIVATLTSNGDAHSGFRDEKGLVPVPFDTTQITSAANYSNPKPGDPCHPLASGAHSPAIAGSAVRRLTPRECERLQGFPDNFTLVPYRNGMMSDGPRYKALGNSMAVPVMRWIGERIQMVEALTAERLAA